MTVAERNRNRTVGARVVAFAVVLTGCSATDPAPVPDAAEAPFVCDGVQQRGAELALGGAVALGSADGSWGDGDRFGCLVEREGDGAVNLQVTSMVPDEAVTWGGTVPMMQVPSWSRCSRGRAVTRRRRSAPRTDLRGPSGGSVSRRPVARESHPSRPDPTP